MEHIEYKADYQAEAVADAGYALRGKNVQALILLLAARLQTLEGAFHALLYGRLLDNAVGVSLEHYAFWVGERRDGLKDGDLRRLVRARVLANRSRGELWRLLRILSQVLGADSVRPFESYPCAMHLNALVPVQPSLLLQKRLHAVLRAAVAAGVHFDGAVVAQSGAAFGFQNTPGALGFGEGIFGALLED